MSDIKITQQKTVTLYDDEMLAVKTDDDQVYVAVNHMCDALGINSPAQRRRIRDHEVLGSGYVLGTVVTEGGPQQVALLRSDLVPLWLIGIQIKSVREDVRPKMKIFIERGAEVLAEAFREGRLTSDAAFEELLQDADSESVQAYRMLQAMVKLARNQIMLESRLDQYATQLGDHETRLEAVESILGDTGRHVTPDQAMQISQAVKAVALELGKTTKRNEFGGVYGELYRRFGVTSYKEIPASKFDDVMKWLREWHQSVTGDEPF